jgi:DNA-binding transcriptional regulator YiaG
MANKKAEVVLEYDLDKKTWNTADVEAAEKKPSEKKSSSSKRKYKKLSPDAVKQIIERYKAGGVTQRQLAEEFGTTQANISFIVRGITHKSMHTNDS